MFAIATALDDPLVESLQPWYPVLLSGFRLGQLHSPVSEAFSTSFSVKTFCLVSWVIALDSTSALVNPQSFRCKFSCSWSSLNSFFASELYPFHPELDLFANFFYGERSRDMRYTCRDPDYFPELSFAHELV